MPAYITLVNLTDQGAKAIQFTVKRTLDAQKILEALGGRKIAVWWTMGLYDLVFIGEAPDDEVYGKFLAEIAKLGNARTTTLRGFNEEEARRVFGGG